MVATPAPAQYPPHPIPEAERWATITHAGNEPYMRPVGSEVFPIGRVDYEFQISRTEVTGGEWLEFVNAYAPYVVPYQAASIVFLGYTIYPAASGGYGIAPSNVNRPVEISWRYAARYVNWLHNNKATNREAFENGAYDTSTFGDAPGFEFTDQAAHHPDARYWIPTLDEWTKSSYFDPDRYGPGSPGYWQFPNRSDSPPVGGPPELGGQTSAYYEWYMSGHRVPSVAAYRDVQSPWGLWDVSGGVNEWTESLLFDDAPPFIYARLTKGTRFGDHFTHADSIDGGSALAPDFNVGFRVARAVPTTGSVVMAVCALHHLIQRRRRRYEPQHLDRCLDVGHALTGHGRPR